MEIVDGIWIRATDHSAVFICQRFGIKPDSLKKPYWKWLINPGHVYQQALALHPLICSFGPVILGDFFVFSDGMDFLWEFLVLVFASQRITSGLTANKEYSYCHYLVSWVVWLVFDLETDGTIYFLYWLEYCLLQ